MAPTKPTGEGGQGVETGGAVRHETTATVRASSPNSARLLSSILRLLAIVLTLVATIVMGVAKQTVIIDVTEDYSVEGKAKSTYNSSFVYFIIVNAVACVYSAVSVGLSFTNQNSSAIHLPLSIADLIIAILLFTGNASAAAIEIVAKKGNSHFGWAKFCNYTGKFCDHVTASIVLSMFASAIYALLLVLSMISHQTRSN